MLLYFVIFSVLFATCMECRFVNKYHSKIRPGLRRSVRGADRIDNATCTDICFDELSNYTNGLQTNTSIVIHPNGNVFFRIEPVDFDNICPIYQTTLPCLKKCNDPEDARLIDSFGGLTFLCIDKYKEVKPNYKCVDNALIENPKLDECVTDCLENITKSNPPTTGNETVQDCSSFRCIAKCGLKIVAKACKPEAVKVSRQFLKVQMDTLQKTEDHKLTWPKDCSDFQKTLDSDKPVD